MPGCCLTVSLDDAVGLTDMARRQYARRGAHRQEHSPPAGRLATSIGVPRLAGYEDVNDADWLCRDPTMRWVVGGRAITGSAASASQMSRFETKWLSRPENLAALADLPGQWIGKVHRRRPPTVIVLDMDSSESPPTVSRKVAPTMGILPAPSITQCSCLTGLTIWAGVRLRPGNLHSAKGWRAVLEPQGAGPTETSRYSPQASAIA
jgi:Transposase DDE domain group 1